MSPELPKAASLEEAVFGVGNEKDFTRIALEVFHFQYQHNILYRSYCDRLNRTPVRVKALQDIPYLPIAFFKSHRVMTGTFDPELNFRSSGTTGTTTSHHFVKSVQVYRQSFLKAFKIFYGNPGDYCILGLLPSYLERGNSSLVYMVEHLIHDSAHPESGFYLHDAERLARTVQELESRGQKTLLIGVTYALLNFAERYPGNLAHTIIMETGGMKGRRQELVRGEVHDVLKRSFGLSSIHSEYGMTELLSQAYSHGEGVFRAPPWMKLLLREESDPFSVRAEGSGVLNVIDLANLYSCSFIATEDGGKVSGSTFEVLGRVDNSDVRGCSLLAL
jgi:phenylacetate-coenzyme A ligase PaaK-like adenylate-forming protein